MLFKHQRQSLEQTEGLNRVAYFLDMGLGKTFVGTEKMLELGARNNLIICQKSKIADWLEHIQQYAWEFGTAYDLTNTKQFDAFMKSKAPKIGVINYELAWRRKDLSLLTGYTLMLDESSLIQNRTAKQTKFILKLKPENVILLSGTPTDGKYENLWTQAHMLGWDITESLFNQQFINWTRINVRGFVRPIVDKKNPYKNVDRLKAKLREHGAIFMKTEEVMDLPEQNFIDVKVKKSREYGKFARDSIIEIKLDDEEDSPTRTLVGDTTLTKRLFKRQLCGAYSTEKLSALRDLLESTNDRIIVFYNFNDELNQIKKLVDEVGKPVSIVNGDIKDLTAYENEGDSVTLIQYQAGAMGLNLQKANKVVYFTLPERSALFEQSKKRVHRIGQGRPCFYYIMKCENSVEEQIHEALKMRKDFTDELFIDDL